MKRSNQKGAVLVSGSSRGIGEAIAKRLGKVGHPAVINYVKSAKLAENVARSIEGVGGRAITFKADVGDHVQVENMVEATVEKFGGIQIVVNNAGFSQHTTIDRMSPEDWNRAVAVNLSSAFYMVKSSVAYLKKQEWGRVINICSLRAMTGSDHGAHYAASKSGLIGLTKSLALELAPNITVNAISPGYTRTDMTATSLKEKGDQIRAKIPANRVAEPDEIARLVAFLGSEDAGYITGQTINANGGIYM